MGAEHPLGDLFSTQLFFGFALQKVRVRFCLCDEWRRGDTPYHKELRHLTKPWWELRVSRSRHETLRGCRDSRRRASASELGSSRPYGVKYIEPLQLRYSPETAYGNQQTPTPARWARRGAVVRGATATDMGVRRRTGVTTEGLGVCRRTGVTTEGLGVRRRTGVTTEGLWVCRRTGVTTEGLGVRRRTGVHHGGPMRP